LAEAAPWYRDGLRFACQQCGHCCRGTGTVRVSDAEIEELASRLDLADDAFRQIYTRTLRDGSVSLRERGNHDCVFYERGSGCRVYEDRPRQCRTWPFWGAVVHSPERWEEESRTCPGMDQGPLHSRERILGLSGNDGTASSRRR